MITQEIFERLKPYEKHLKRGVGNYVFGFLAQDFDALYEIYKELGHNERLNYSCSNCCVRLTKTLGQEYFEYKKWMESQPVEEPKAETPVETHVEEKPVTKRKKTVKTKKTTKKEVS